MSATITKDQWNPRKNAIIFADEDVDGVCSAAIVGRRYFIDERHFTIRFVNARNLGEALKDEAIFGSESTEPQVDEETDVFIVDVGINKANIKLIEQSIANLVKKGARVMYFDSHSNKYKGKNLLLHLENAKANVYNGKIGLAAATIVHEFLGNDDTARLRLLGALSDREIQLTNRFKGEKAGLRALQAAVAWGAYKDEQFLDRITRRLIRHPDMDLEADKDILEYSIKANNHRDNLLRHVHKKAKILQISETPRILCVSVLDRIDFGKARGTIAGRLAGEWGAAIILITQSVSDNSAYAVTVRNSYVHKLDLEMLGQLAGTQNSGGSKGAYRLTVPKDELMSFLAKVQTWSRTVKPPWEARGYSKSQKVRRSKPRNYRRKKRREDLSTDETNDREVKSTEKLKSEVSNVTVSEDIDDDEIEIVVDDDDDFELVNAKESSEEPQAQENLQIKPDTDEE